MKDRFAFLLSFSLIFPVLFAGLSVRSVAQISVTTYHNDNARTGENLNERTLRPGNVNARQFGKLFSFHVDGNVYAQPLYLSQVEIPGKGMRNVLYAATEHDSVYAFDADRKPRAAARPLWVARLVNAKRGITPLPAVDVESCTSIVPEIGITGTPAIDEQSGTIYLVAKSKENGRFVQRLHALSVATGKEKFGGPVEIAATVEGSGDGSDRVNFDPLWEAQRAGLLVQGGFAYIAWASHCDFGLYHGWIMAYHAQTLKQGAVWNATPNGTKGGIWQSGSGPAAEDGADAAIYFGTGNGTFDSNQNDPRDFGDSVVKLDGRGGRLRLEDYFTPDDEAELEEHDNDLGSGGVVLIPGDGATHRRLLVEVGKEGAIYMIDRDRMGHFNPDSNDQIVQFLPHVVNGMWATPAWWDHNLYFGSSNDNLKQFAVDRTSGFLSAAPVSESATFFNFPGPTPSISSNGDKNAIMWVLQNEAYINDGPAILHAYDANDLSQELYNSAQNPGRDSPGGALRFAVPTVANGRVYVGTVNQVSVYGELR